MERIPVIQDLSGYERVSNVLTLKMQDDGRFEICERSELFLKRLGYRQHVDGIPELAFWDFRNLLPDDQPKVKKDELFKNLCEMKEGALLEFPEVCLRCQDSSILDFTITAIKKGDDRIKIGLERSSSLFDFMTGFYNLPAFLSLVDLTIQELYRDKVGARKSENKMTERMFFYMLDMDNFKGRINDKYGPSEGDRAILITAEAFGRFFRRAREYKGRLGGDEFAVIVSKDYHVGFLEAAAADMTKFIDGKWGVAGEVGFTAGFAFFDPEQFESRDDLPSAADLREQASAMIKRRKTEKGVIRGSFEMLSLERLDGKRAARTKKINRQKTGKT